MLLLLALAYTFVSLSVEAEDNSRVYKYASDYILEGLNKDVKACDKPFEFVCGKWWSGLDVKNETNYFYEDRAWKDDTVDLLTEAIKTIDVNDQQTPVYKKWLRTFFDQCMNYNLTPEEILKQIFNGIQRVIGPPPLLTFDKTAHDTLLKRNVWHLAGLIQRKLVEGVFFRTTVENWGQQMPAISFEPPWSVESELNETDMIEQISQVVKLFGLKLEEAEISKAVADMINFDRDLKSYSNKSLENEDLWEYTEANSTDYLKTLIPNIDWKEFFGGLFSPEQLYYWDQTTAQFKIRNKNYFLHIDEVVKKYSVDTVFNTIFYQGMKNMFIYAALTESFADSNRTVECVGLAKSVQTAASARIYSDYTKQDPLEWRGEIFVIADNVISALKVLTAKAEWISIPDTAAIYAKLNSIKFVSPIPVWLSDETKLENMTIKFEADKGAYDNAFNIAKRAFVLDLERYVRQTPVDEALSFYDTSIMYSFMEIKASFGAVLAPWYHLRYPSAVKYGSLGVQVAKAVLQAFVEDNWSESFPNYDSGLNASTVKFVQNEVACLNDQIKTLDCKDDPSKCSEGSWVWNYTLTGYLKDIDSLKLAYMAYRMDARSKSEQPLPGLTDYNWDQIFFLTAGRRLCSSALRDSEDEGGLSTTKNRLVKAFRNFPLYAKSFQCSSGDAVLAKTCGVWDIKD